MHTCPNCLNEHPNDSLCDKCTYIDFGLDTSIPTNKKEKMDHFYMKIAELSAKNSYAKRLKVGAVLVKEENIISFGWNGMPRGMDNCCEINEANATKPEVIHSEVNCLGKLAKSGGNANGSTLYLTHSMCYDCCKLIIASGIIRVVYKEKYRIYEPIKFLESAGVLVEQLN